MEDVTFGRRVSVWWALRYRAESDVYECFVINVIIIIIKLYNYINIIL